MLLRKKSLICSFAVIFVMLFATVGATGLTQIAGTAHASDEIAPKLFEVTVGGTTTAYSTVEEAFAAANNAGTATVKMLADAEIAKTLTVAAGNNITLNGRQ